MFCKNCGKEINDQAVVCVHCGCAVANAAPKAANPTAPMVGAGNDGKGLSIAALVLGLIGLVFAWFGWFCYVALACAIAGIIFGGMGMNKSKAANGKASGLAVAGLVLGIIGTVFALFAVLVCTIILGAANAIENEIYNYGNYGGYYY